MADDYIFDLGSYSRPITTSSADAQRWFDRGLNWIWAYNHEEAGVCFKNALEHDPDCAMAYWGLAYIAGPNYNRPWERIEETDVLGLLPECRRNLRAAGALSDRLTDVERDLIQALEVRYQDDAPPEDLYKWSAEYTVAMREVYAKHSDDMDVSGLFAEAMMNRNPWNMWSLETGAATEGSNADECRTVLEAAIEKNRAAGRDPHPGVWHLYIHLMEMSKTPEAALRVGDEIRHLVPDSGHLAHMPTHIDIQCGYYQDVVDSNHIGIEKDVKYWEYAGALNFYSNYRVHNYHFKLYGAMFLGQFDPAIEAATTMHETIPDALIRMEDPPMADWQEAYMSIGTHALVRFGKWQELIDDPLPEDQDLYLMTTAMNYYGKGIAYAALKQHDNALRAQQQFEEAAAKVPPTRILHVVPCPDILGVAREMLAGEIAYHHGDYDEAFAHLRQAVANEDSLPFDEPWGWMMPSRHALGALLLEQGHAEEAAHAYETDLGLNEDVIRQNRHPNNVWALLGLHRCYEALGRTDEARAIKPQLDIALARADKSIQTSCFCAVTTGPATVSAGQKSCCH
ncbi:tetratricopeptide repeat protein [Gordonia hydrophobica]|uniref:Tetratricopeptide repeat protein n=1 Tax=Gordonia hydrophobica TaxID=40516 RepID=A0ABZ2U5M9_9ACTN|nr:tetratricopeptide repeat protein [Gordonia hydrophobica]MBM7368695.1 tetratricopeptide (TPR) repeat protein [Gordonia hydrophobica]